jgi:hypothetical protein
MIQNAGTQAIASGTDAAIGTSGVATRVFTVHLISDGTATVTSLRNGTAASATAFATETGTASTGKTINYGLQGMMFPSGCFLDVDAHCIGGIVTYAQEK